MDQIGAVGWIRAAQGDAYTAGALQASGLCWWGWDLARGFIAGVLC